MPIGKLNFDIKNADIRFNIDVELFSQVTFDKNIGGYEEWVVIANGFIIAHFVDEPSGIVYMKWLQKFGFTHFPKKIIDILEMQWLNGVGRTALTKGKIIT